MQNTRLASLSPVRVPCLPRNRTARSFSFTGRVARTAAGTSRGMTIVEVIIALGLLAILSVSVISVTFQVRSMAEQTVYQNTALTLAQGYMEQVRHLDYTTLKACAQSASVALPLDKTDGTPVVPESGSLFGNSVWSKERVFLDQTVSGTPIQPMDFRFRTVLTSLETATTNLASGVEITIQYQVTYDYGVRRVVNGTLRSVRSSVPTY
jgi:prepilin-type N-terminal cleavage/methylation domain-containing protein